VKPAILITLIAVLTACAPFEPINDVHIVVIDDAVDAEVQGNIGHFPNTQTAFGDPLPAFILGEPLPSGSRVPIRVVGVHDQVNGRGTKNTIIATTERGKTFENLEQEFPGLRRAIGKTLADLQSSRSISLGIREQDEAYTTIARYRDAYEGSDARRFIRSVPQ